MRSSQLNTPTATTPYAGLSDYAHQHIWNQLPWYDILQLQVRALRREFYHIVHISAVEIRNLPRRTKIPLHEIRSPSLARTEGILLVPNHPDSSIWKPSSSEYIRQLVARTPWASLYDLSLCHQGWQAAIESLRRHIQDSDKARTDTQT
jgi:hypothetical protein